MYRVIHFQKLIKMNPIRVLNSTSNDIPHRISKYHAIPILTRTKGRKQKQQLSPLPHISNKRTSTNHPAIFSPFHTTFHSSFHPSYPPKTSVEVEWKAKS